MDALWDRIMWFQSNIFQPREIQRSCCGKPVIQIQITSAGQNETQKLIRSVMLHLIINNTQQPRCVCKVKGIGHTKKGTVQLPHRKGFDAIKSRPRWAGPTKAFTNIIHFLANMSCSAKSFIRALQSEHLLTITPVCTQVACGRGWQIQYIYRGVL